jgi:hypothetical protein
LVEGTCMVFETGRGDELNVSGSYRLIAVDLWLAKRV